MSSLEPPLHCTIRADAGHKTPPPTLHSSPPLPAPTEQVACWLAGFLAELTLLAMAMRVLDWDVSRIDMVADEGSCWIRTEESSLAEDTMARVQQPPWCSKLHCKNTVYQLILGCHNTPHRPLSRSCVRTSTKLMTKYSFTATSMRLDDTDSHVRWKWDFDWHLAQWVLHTTGIYRSQCVHAVNVCRLEHNPCRPRPHNIKTSFSFQSQCMKQLQQKTTEMSIKFWTLHCVASHSKQSSGSQHKGRENRKS